MPILGGFGEVAAALVVFFASHSLPAMPGARDRLVRWLGHRTYIVLHSLASTATLVWLVIATLGAPYVELWGRHQWAVWVPILVMPFAFILLVAGATSPNPFSLGAGSAGFDPANPGIVAITRHPVLWGAALWTGSHLFPNGELRAVLLFGGLGLFSLMGTRLYDRRRAARLGQDQWRRLSAGTSNLPLAALIAGRAHVGRLFPLGWRIVLGLATYIAILLLHAGLFGFDPLQSL